MHKLITSAEGSDDLSIGLNRDRHTGQRELTKSKIIKGKCHLRNMLKGIFGFSEHQEKATNELVFNLTLTRKADNSVLSKDNADNIGKVKLKLLYGMCRIIHPVFHSKPYYLNKF